jgi:hypothetical protein
MAASGRLPRILTVVILPAALFALVTLAIETWIRRRRGVRPFALAAVPAAMLFLIFPVAPLLLDATRLFQQIAREGTNAPSAVGGIMQRLDRALLVGCLAAVVTLVLAWTLERGGAAEPKDVETEPPPDVRATVSRWVIVVCSLLIVPTAVLMYVAEDVPRLTVVAMELTTGLRRDTTPPDLSGFSETIASRLVLGVWLGLALTGAAVVAAAASLIAAVNLRPIDRLRTWTWLILAIVAAGAIGYAVRLNAHIALTARATAAAARHPSQRPDPGEPAASFAQADSPIRFDGVYRTDTPVDGTFRYWSFQPGGQCWPYATPSDSALPPPQPAGRLWTCDFKNGAVALTYSEKGAAVKTGNGTVRDRETIVIDGHTFRFVEGTHLR